MLAFFYQTKDLLETVGQCGLCLMIVQQEPMSKRKTYNEQILTLVVGLPGDDAGFLVHVLRGVQTQDVEGELSGVLPAG